MSSRVNRQRTEKEVICMRCISTDAEYLDEVIELAGGSR